MFEHGSLLIDAMANITLPEVGPKLMEFRSRRSAVLGTRGVVACRQPLAAEVNVELRHIDKLEAEYLVGAFVGYLDLKIGVEN